jgi:hypothetical protein
MNKEPLVICDKAKQCRVAATGDYLCCQHSIPHTPLASCEWDTICGEDKETGEELTGVCIPV